MERMDNPGYTRDPDTGTELKIVQTTNGSPTQAGPSNCKPDVCRKSRERHTPPDLNGSPWHTKKTIFLISIVGCFVIWIAVYATLSQLNYL